MPVRTIGAVGAVGAILARAAGGTLRQLGPVVNLGRDIDRGVTREEIRRGNVHLDDLDGPVLS